MFIYIHIYTYTTAEIRDAAEQPSSDSVKRAVSLVARCFSPLFANYNSQRIYCGDRPRSQANRIKQLEMRQERERQDLHQKFAADEGAVKANSYHECVAAQIHSHMCTYLGVLLKKHRKSYQKLVEETANRATGGIIQASLSSTPAGAPAYIH